MLQQAQFREGVLIPLFQDWLKMALLKGALPGLNYAEFDTLE
jgi:capsid protein